MSPRLAARAVLVHDNRLLLVNAWANPGSDLWCAPGGGVEPGSALPDNLRREVYEETGLTIRVGLPCLVNEFHNPQNGFHQVEIFFRCRLERGVLSDDWADPEAIVTRRKFFTQDEMAVLHVKPDALAEIAWNDGIAYDPLEPIVF